MVLSKEEFMCQEFITERIYHKYGRKLYRWPSQYVIGNNALHHRFNNEDAAGWISPVPHYYQPGHGVHK